MDWKEFFSPDSKKIGFTLFFVILEFVMFFISGFGVLCKTGSSCFSSWYNMIAIVLSIHTYIFVGLTESLFDSPVINILTIIVVNLIIGYLISCILFYFLDKNKK